ncbi:MAG TPA: M15 family metallopeptidase [Candidatus Acidoferrum sp.]|nr:M15 family metallopeptidase [Candidatus Acidoferrum sp.]
MYDNFGFLFKRRPVATAVLGVLCACASLAQSPGSLLPGPKPPDAPADWKRFVGIYEYSSNGAYKHSVIILERNQRPYMRSSSGPDEEIHFDLTAPYDFGQGYRRLGFMFVPDPAKGSWSYEIVEQPGAAPYFTYLMESYVRTDAGADPAHFFRVTPTRPVAKLREMALKLTPPQEPGPFRDSDLVEVAPLDSGIHLDIRYATSNDFLGTPVYSQARAFLQRPAADALLRVQKKLKPLGYALLIHDAYRPWYVTKIFWDATPPEGKIFVADPAQGSRHNRGCAVDLTLYDLATGKPIEMPGTYDEMSPRSFPDYPGGTSLQRWHRDLLRRAMESEGFAVYESEWWHFDYKDWKEYAILNAPFEKLDSGSKAMPVH